MIFSQIPHFINNIMFLPIDIIFLYILFSPHTTNHALTQCSHIFVHFVHTQCHKSCSHPMIHIFIHFFTHLMPQIILSRHPMTPYFCTLVKVSALHLHTLNMGVTLKLTHSPDKSVVQPGEAPRGAFLPPVTGSASPPTCPHQQKK